MKLLQTSIIALLAVLPFPSRASWFEYCDIKAEINKSAVTSINRTYTLEVKVLSASRAKRGGKNSYTDCSEHIAKTMTINIRLPYRALEPAAGDHIVFYRSAADGFSADGSYAGTSTTIRFLKLLKNKTNVD